MKASKQCPKCDSMRIGYLEQLHDQVSHDDAVKSSYTYVPRKVGVTESNCRLHYLEGHGCLEAYVCADCGYHETYMKDAQSISFDDLKGFHWLNPEPSDAGPYR